MYVIFSSRWFDSNAVAYKFTILLRGFPIYNIYLTYADFFLSGEKKKPKLNYATKDIEQAKKPKWYYFICTHTLPTIAGKQAYQMQVIKYLQTFDI